MKWVGLLLFIVLIGGVVFFYNKTSLNTKDVEQENHIVPTVALTPTPQLDMEEVVLEYPQAGQVIESPLKFKGIAKGGWFFEGSFPVILTNWDGLIIGEGLATAKEDWMREEVEFEGELEFEVPEYGDNGFLILKKDNPSGLPENDDAVEIEVRLR